MQIRHKFNAKRCERDGVKFASKAERTYYDKLEILKKAGEVLFFLTQVPIRLPGGTKYVCDFVVFYTDGLVRFVDVKGIETDSFKIKKREVEAIYPLEIEIEK
jgi:hypothetical protein